MKPIFGEREEKIHKIKTKKNTNNAFPPIDFKLCEECKLKLIKGEYLIHRMFMIICDNCKHEFCEMANHTRNIGNRVKII